MKKIITITIIVILLVSLFSQTTSATSNAKDFAVSNGILTEYSGPGGDVVIPGNLGITEIGDHAFYGSKITSIVIPEGVTRTDYFSFASCSSLTAITYPKSMTEIGDASFFNCDALTTVVIPEGIREIGDTAFADCGNLTSVVLPKSIQTIGTEIFVNSKIATPIFIKNNSVICYVPQWYSNYSIPQTVKEIAGGAFYKCTALQSVDIPFGVTAINDTAFFGCTALSSLTIPDSVVSIGYSAFFGCSRLSSLTLPRNVNSVGFSAFQGTSIPDPIYLGNGSILCYVPARVTTFEIAPAVRTIVGGAFGGCVNLKSIRIPDTVTTIDTRLFTNCSALESVTLPQSMTSIGDYMFMNCTSLKSITLPDHIISIGSSAFMGCKNLNSIIIPTASTVSETMHFGDCTALKTIILPESITNVKNNAFFGAGLQSIYILNKSVTFGGTVFYYNDNLTIYGLPDSTAEQYAQNYKIPFSYIFIAKPNASGVTVNGQATSFEAYTIGGYNFFKLRDLAQVLNGTGKQFDVSFTSSNNAINIVTGKSYTPVGGELKVSGNKSTVMSTQTSSTVFLDGKAIDLIAYTINGYNYFKLRDIGVILNFSVMWDDVTSTIRIDTSKPYDQYS